MEIASSEWHPSERWCDDYTGYCPYTSDPVGYESITNKPIFEGDCTWLCCGINDNLIEKLPF